MATLLNGQMVLLGTVDAASGANETIKINRQGAYERISILCLDSSGNPVAYGTEISTIEMKAGSISLCQPVDPDVLNKIDLYFNASKGVATQTGVIPMLDPTILSGNDELNQAAYFIGTNGLSSLDLKIKFGTVTNIATVEVYGYNYQGGEFDTVGLGRHLRLAVETRTAHGTGQQSFDNYPHVDDPDAGLVAIFHANASGTGTIKSMRVDIGNDVGTDVPLAVMERQAASAGRTVQSSAVAGEDLFCFDFSTGNSRLSFVPLRGVDRIKTVTDWSVSPAAQQNKYILTVHGVGEEINAIA